MRGSARRIIVFLIFLYGVKVVLQYLYWPLGHRVTFSDGIQDRSLNGRPPIQSKNNNSNPHSLGHQEGKARITSSFLDHEEQKPHPPKPTAIDTMDGIVQEEIGDSRKSYFVGDNKPDDILLWKRPSYLKNYKNPCWYEGSVGNTTLKCLPYFRLIGVDKCGTTDLWYRMSKHPEIVRPQAVMGKETHWWSWRRFGFDIWVRNRPIFHFDWYLSHFDKPAKKIEEKVVTRNGNLFHPLVTGEGSPTEFWDFTGWNLIPQNANKSSSTAIVTPHCLHHVTPDLKAIVIFRNPISRTYSDYLFLDQFRHIPNISSTGFHMDVVSSIQMLEDCVKSNNLVHCLHDKDLHMRMPVRLIPGMYDIFLSKWLQVFPPDNILVMRNEDYSADIKTHLKTIFHFLGLSPLTENELSDILALPRIFEKTARAKSVGPMLNKTRELLHKFYQPYNKMLANRFNDSRYLWDS